MDFLKSAVASAISKGPPFPYSFGERVDIDQSIWALYNGTRREDGSLCSIFSFDAVANKSRLPLARNAVRKLRTLRHPGVIKVLDTVETDTYIYIATERLTPLGWHVRRKSLSADILKWGLYSVAKTLKFINEEASSVHGNVRVSSIFTSESGEWKLGGLDVLSSMKDDEATIYTYGSLVPDSGRYAPPEVVKTGWDAIKRNPLSAVDAYNFGTLIFEVFNGSFSGGDQTGQTKNVPPTMHQSYKKLTNPNPKVRLSVAHFLEQGRKSGGFFESPLIRLTDGVENLGLKTERERENFLNELDSVSDDFPEEFFKLKVLPELLKSIEFGGGGPKAFAVVMKIGSRLADDDYNTRVTPVIIRLFASPDRAIRVCLLDSLPLMIDRLSQKVVNDKIFPQMVTGFTDVAPVVREQTVKAVLTVATKLSDRTTNGELLKYLAKTSNDEQPGIRTNTTICLGKIAKHLSANTRQKVLAAAFARSLRDPFVHARNAALQALGATLDVFTEEDCATKILPAICPSLVDKEKLIRDQANKTVDLYLQRVRKYSATLPDTVLPPPNSAESSNAAVPRIGTPQHDTSWAGWAISSFTNKLAAASGEMESSPNASAVKPDNRSTSLPPPVETARTSSSTGSASTLHRQALAPPSAPVLIRTTTADFFNAVQDADDELDDAWGDLGEDSYFDAPSEATSMKLSTPVPSFDDGGEPDFAGWLNAQAKAKSKKPLPKGIMKSASSANRRPVATGRTATSGSDSSAATLHKPSNITTTPKAAIAKKIDIKPKDEVEEANAWGDAWD